MAHNDTPLSNQIYNSRDEIRSQIINYMKTFLELENVDLTKSSFLSFLVNTMSTLTSNLLFYQSSVYREFFLTKAQLSESVYNLSSFLGYSIQRAKTSSVDILFTVPLEFTDNDITFSIPNGFNVTARNVDFRTTFKTNVNVKNNSSVTVSVEEENRSYNLPVVIDTTANNEFYFLLTVQQYIINNQEFQIDEDTKQFQFVNIDISISGKAAGVSVFIREPDSSFFQEYTEYSSLFLMGASDRGFVSRESGDGLKIYFGNGLIGYQPQPGSTVLVEIQETEGADGNVIAGSITNGDRIFIDTEDGRQILNYSITNTNPSTGGEDEESLEDIRANSIDNLTSLQRLVSESDYKSFNLVTGTDIINNPFPVLKRSDLKVNEIQVYSTIYNISTLVPTRNEILKTTETEIPRGSIITKNGIDYIILFDLNIDSINKFAKYKYISKSFSVIPPLVKTYKKDYNFVATKLNVYKDSNNAVFELEYTSTEPDYTTLECDMIISTSSETFSMSNNFLDNKFVKNIVYENLPDGELDLLFNISTPSELVESYSATVTFKRNLNDKMMSNVTILDSTSPIEFEVYDIPVVEKSYYDGIDQELFELQVLQKIVNLNLIDRRMLTDFVNIKFTNTTGKLQNMLKNQTDSEPVLAMISELPNNPNLGDRYILSEDGRIATYNGTSWTFVNPFSDSIIHVQNLDYKVIYSGDKWIKPEYNIPLQIELEVFLEDLFTGSEVAIVDEIKNTLLSKFSSRFGSDTALYKSEIIDIVQSVDGVKNCYLISPRTSIFFNYELENFTQQELLEYSPEFVYFNKESIFIRIL